MLVLRSLGIETEGRSMSTVVRSSLVSPLFFRNIISIMHHPFLSSQHILFPGVYPLIVHGDIRRPP